MKKALFLFFVLLSIPAFSQDEKDSYQLYLERSKETLNPHFITGEWHATDSAGGTIRFELSETGLHLFAGQSYYFHLKDSTGYSAIGTLVQWPPQDCYVKVVGDNTIEVQFYNYYTHPAMRQFRRVKKV